MNPRNCGRPWLAFATAVATFAATPVIAQSTQSADADLLKKFDKNRNGVLDPDEQAAFQAEQKKKEPKVESSSKDSTGGEDEAIHLSPFMVTSEGNRGYEAANVMSGSRINTKLEDVAASISVVTKEQLMDFAAVDLNDIFAMEVGTEGTRTYTGNINDGKGDVDRVSNNPEQANRVRGLGSPNMAVGNFGMSSSIPVDTYNIDGVEISRGANSSIFGVGEGNGVVNLIPASANVLKDRTSVSTTASSYGTIRGTIDLNRPIFKNVLAVRVSAMSENKGYVRNPAYDKTRRITFGTTFKPFRYTTIRASYEGFHEVYSRPNSTTATNFMSLWVNAGRPSYDPSTNTYKYTAADGTVISGVQKTAATTAFPTGVWLTGMGSTRTRPTMWIDSHEAEKFTPSYWVVPTTYNTAGVPTAWTEREIVNFGIPTNYNVPSQYIGGIGFNGVPASTDKSFYDYERINLAALNSGMKSATFKRAEFEQFLLNSQRQVLAAQLGAFEEDITDLSRAYVGNGGDGIALTIAPDVNEKYPDGSPNPHFGAPMIQALAPQIYSRPVKSQTLKANLAYQLDLTHERGLLKWLGKQRLIGYKEYNQKEYSPSALRYRTQITNSFTDRLVPTITSKTQPLPDLPWLAAPLGTNNNSTLFSTRYFLGDGQGANVDYASSAPNLSNNIIYNRWGSYSSSSGFNQWYPENTKVKEVYFAIGSQQVQTRTRGYVWQGYFWKDRILPLYGERQDSVRARNNNPEPAGVRDSNGFLTDENWLMEYNNSPWLVVNKYTGATENKGTTRTKGIVFKALPWLHLRYNQSNAFKPEDYAIDYKGDPLPNPYGKTKDYGITLILADNRLVIRATKYETFTKDARQTSLNTVANRITTMDFDNDITNDSVKFDVEDWLYNEYAKVDGYTDASTATADLQAKWTQAAHKYMGLTDEYIATMRTYTRAMTSDAQSKGYELEVNYNPSKYWTMKITGNKMEAITSNIAGTWQWYRDLRLSVWQSLKSPYTDPTTGVREAYWTKTFSGNTVPSTYFASTVDAPMRLNIALQGKPVPQNRKYKFNFMTNYRFAGVTSNKYLKNFNLGGRVSWEDRAAIGFRGAAAEADGIVRSYDANSPIMDQSHFYCDMFAGYDFRLWRDRVRSRVQLNVRNVFENGRLQAFTANPDGNYTRYRIIDPREFVLTVSFDL